MKTQTAKNAGCHCLQCWAFSERYRSIFINHFLAIPFLKRLCCCYKEMQQMHIYAQLSSLHSHCPNSSFLFNNELNVLEAIQLIYQHSLWKLPLNIHLQYCVIQSKTFPSTDLSEGFTYRQIFPPLYNSHCLLTVWHSDTRCILHAKVAKVRRRRENEKTILFKEQSYKYVNKM